MKPARCVRDVGFDSLLLIEFRSRRRLSVTLSFGQLDQSRNRGAEPWNIYTSDKLCRKEEGRQTERSEDDWENKMQIGGKRERVSGGQLCQCTGILGLSKALIFVGLGAIGQVQRSLSSHTAQDFILSLRASPTSGLDGRSNQPLPACHHRLISDTELVINVRAPELTSHPSTDSLLIHFCTIIGENVYHW